MQRVVITGMGAITPAGSGAEQLFENLCAGKNGMTAHAKIWEN